MKKLYIAVNCIVLVVLLFIISSCASRSNTACPTFRSNKDKTRIRHKNIHDGFYSKRKPIFKEDRSPEPKKQEDRFVDFDELYLNTTASLGSNNLTIFTDSSFTGKVILNHKTNDTVLTSDHTVTPDRAPIVPYQTIEKSKKSLNKKPDNRQNRKVIKGDINILKKSDADKPNNPERKVSIIKGSAIILMAILSGFTIPALGTLTASIGLVSIFLLDLLISFGIYKYYKKKKPRLGLFASLLRLLYSAVFSIGIGYHIAGNVTMFNKLWNIGLIGFGLHLIALGILFNNEGGKKWVNILIKSLLIAAGIGYMIIDIGVLVVPNPIAFRALMESVFFLPMILCEVLFAIWMILKGGKKAI